MRYVESSNPDDFISDLKYSEDGEFIRLTFRWPNDMGQVYIFKAEDSHNGSAVVFDIKSARSSGARLFTQQEYKKSAGFTDKKTPGTYTYHIFPFIREDGEDILIKQADGKNNITCLTGQTVIRFSIKEKNNLFGGGKLHLISLVCEQPVDSGVLCYVKKENGYPADARDGTVYFFGEPLIPGRENNFQVKTEKNEFVRIFINKPEAEQIYSLKMK